MRKTCLNEIYKLAQKDERVVFIGSDIGTGTLDDFKDQYPDRFFMEGVSESHLVSMMAGLSMSGKIPYMNTIATFMTRRPYEHILLDGGLHQTNIRIIGSGGGLVYAPLGPTHLALEDIALMRTVPGMTVIAVCDADEMKRMMPQTLNIEGPVYIRLAKGGDEIVSRKELGFEIGKPIKMESGSDVLIISTGITTQIALKAATELKSLSISASVLHVHTIKPLDERVIQKELSSHRAALSVEEHIINGGLGSAVAEVLAEMKGVRPAFKRIGLPNEFPHNYGSQAFLMQKYGVTEEAVVSEAEKLLQKEMI